MESRDADFTIEPYGYYIPSGYRGRIANGKFMTFPTYKEYIEYLMEETE